MGRGNTQKRENRMRKGKRKWMVWMLLLAVCLSIIPRGEQRMVKADSATANVTYLGKLGELSAGTKKKSGKWWKLKVNGKPAFCLNMGYTCHSGDVYVSNNTSFSSKDTGKKKWKAYVGYWFDHTKKEANKAYVFAQALFWSIEEGAYSSQDLINVLTTMKANTGYFGAQSAEALYQEIFGVSGEVNITATVWKYAGSGNHRQELLEIHSASKTEISAKSLQKDEWYRQRITIHKKDDSGERLSQIPFRMEADNKDELYSFQVTGWNSNQQGQAEDMDAFVFDEKTDSNGIISFRFTYKLESQEYYYFSDSDLDKMSDAQKAAEVQKLEKNGCRYHETLTESGAKDLAQKDIESQMQEIDNTYTLTELDSGRKDLMIPDEYQAGKRIRLGKSWSWTRDNSGKWPDTESQTYGEYAQAFRENIVNNRKKASVQVIKKDSYSIDGIPHGNARLDGAVFQIYDDPQCTKIARIIREDGSQKESPGYQVKGGFFDTGYLLTDRTYYLKEEIAPEGYELLEKVIPFEINGMECRAEYTKRGATVEVGNTPFLGQIAIQKYMSDGSAGSIMSEDGVSFQVYLKSAGSYEKANEYERDMIKTDKDGYGCSKNLYYGEYVVHQADTGAYDTLKVEDFCVKIAAEKKDKPYQYVLNNPMFNAYLKIIKKDGNTNKTVLKPGTGYQIFKVLADGTQKQVIQSYSTGNGMKKVDTFYTDATGQVMTVKPLVSGTYRIYETAAASGYYNKKEVIEFEINSKENNYETFEDEEGNTFACVTVYQENRETVGVLKLKKTGQQLASFQNGAFVYENMSLDGVVFEVLAKEDIKTQDASGEVWFQKGDTVATITTGKGTEFTNDCAGICSYQIDPEGTIVIHLPLGKYEIIEKSCPEGFVRNTRSYEFSFSWETQDQEYVLDTGKNSTDDGTIVIPNQQAKGKIAVEKTDQYRKIPVAGAIYGIYTKHDIWNYKGEKILNAGDMIGSLTTDQEGKAVLPIEVPIQSSLGSTGEYYAKELWVSSSYYCEQQTIPLHCQYQDDRTATIVATAKIREEPTKTGIQKVDANRGQPLNGCKLQLCDENGCMIVEWITGQRDSVTTSISTENSYCNFAASMKEDGELEIYGLLQGHVYQVQESDPAPGYTTAAPIRFTVGKESQRIRMQDDTTKVEFVKMGSDTNRLLQGAKMTLEDEQGNIIDSFTTSKARSKKWIGKLAVGKTYCIREKTAPAGYERANKILFTVKDTSEVQKITMIDRAIVTLPEEDIPRAAYVHETDLNASPDTADPAIPGIALTAFVVSIGCMGVTIRAKRRRKSRLKSR